MTDRPPVRLSRSRGLGAKALFGAGILIVGASRCIPDEGQQGSQEARANGSSSGMLPDGSPEAGGTVDAGPDAQVEPSCGTITKPDVVPQNWVPWTGWGCYCPLWIPPNEFFAPPPIVWEPCPLPEPGLDCRQMKVTPPMLIGVHRFGYTPEGKPLLVFNQVVQGDGISPQWNQIVAEADGPVRFAMMQAKTWQDGCRLDPADVGGGKFAFNVQGDGTAPTMETEVDGLIWGELGSWVPKAGPKNDSPQEWTWHVGEGWWINGIAPALVDEMYPPDFSKVEVLWDPSKDPDGLPALSVTMRVVGADILFDVGTLSMRGIMAFDKVNGVHPLVRWYGDKTKGAGNIGTDGKLLVWTFGEGKGPGDDKYPTRSIMVAPYTTNQLALQPKRLRSDLGVLDLDPFVVGHGYAGHHAYGPQSLLIVRLADGVSWIIPASETWWWNRVLGFTKDEVFVSIIWPAPNIARIRLDSLGPGIPPD